MSTVYEKIFADNAKHDPHGLKHKGMKSDKHAFPAVPYEHRPFPMMVYFEDKTKIVNSKAELKAAKADGWSPDAPEPAADDAPAE